MGWNEGTNLPPGISDPGNECEFSRREKRQFLAERGWKRDDTELREFWIRGERSLPLDDAFSEVTEEEMYPRHANCTVCGGLGHQNGCEACHDTGEEQYRGDCIQNLMDFTFAFVERDVKLRRMIDRAEAKMRERG